MVVELHDDRVESRIASLAARDRGLQHLRGRHLARADQRGEPDRIMVFVVIELRHNASPEGPAS